MTPLEPGSVVLVRFPFTDLSSTKKRPCVVVSPIEFSTRYGDTVVLALTSCRQKNDLLQLENWREAGLLKPTWIKPVLGTISLSVVDRLLGDLSAKDRTRVAGVLDAMIAREMQIR